MPFTFPQQALKSLSWLTTSTSLLKSHTGATQTLTRARESCLVCSDSKFVHYYSFLSVLVFWHKANSVCFSDSNEKICFKSKKMTCNCSFSELTSHTTKEISSASYPVFCRMYPSPWKSAVDRVPFIISKISVTYEQNLYEINIQSKNNDFIKCKFMLSRIQNVKPLVYNEKNKKFEYVNEIVAQSIKYDDWARIWFI